MSKILPKKKIAVVVLGDIGRSPRMQYHAYSLNKENFDTTIVGYHDSEPSKELVHNIKIVNVKKLPALPYIPKLLEYALKLPSMLLFLFCALYRSGPYNAIIVQNPPAVPTLAAVWIYCIINGAYMILDWHNYTHSIMSLGWKNCTHRRFILVKCAKMVETFYGRSCDYNLCVSRAMRKDLRENMNIEARTLYDKPGPAFKGKISLTERKELFQKLSQEEECFRHFLNRDKNWALCVSSTSWTEDEDIFALLTALKAYEFAKNVPNLVCAITGKGPLKQSFKEKVSSLEWKKVKIVTPWLEAEDYPRFLACADLGVCLHFSASGLDLPMKVVDMFGACLPVCAYNYRCISELVVHGQNGLLFNNPEELRDQLIRWFTNFNKTKHHRDKFRGEIHKFRSVDWHKNWMKVAYPIFKRLKKKN